MFWVYNYEMIVYTDFTDTSNRILPFCYFIFYHDESLCKYDKMVKYDWTYVWNLFIFSVYSY